MGIYLNPDNEEFASITRSGTYVDKSGLVAFVNERLGTPQNLICSTRPRRFGKTYAAQMLAAYYTRGANSRPLFDSLAVANPPNTLPESIRQAKIASYLSHINQTDTILWDMARFVTYCRDDINGIIALVERWTTQELIEAFPDVSAHETLPLAERLTRISVKTGRKFVIIVDEWDVLFREARSNEAVQKNYILFLRSLFKGLNVRRYLLGGYLTGILPIKKYGTESALTDFEEFTMTDPMQMGEFIGFTETEVKHLCESTGRNFSEMRRWYDGYHFEGVGHVYNPRSVSKAAATGECKSYWTTTETYESLKNYIELNFNGLLDAITDMLGGVRQPVDVLSFLNDLSSIKSRDDVLTLLIHLGYLGYDQKTAQAYIPNEEIRQEFIRTIRHGSQRELVKAIELSDKLLKAVLDGNEVEAGLLIGEAHNAGTAPSFYNNEQALRSVVIMAFLSAIDHYHRFEEIAGGRGFVDLCFIPNKTSSKPPLLVELKWNKPAEAALSQMKDKKYETVFHRFGLSRDAILVGICYDSKTGKHECRIEKIPLS